MNNYYRDIKQTLSYFGKDWRKPYYVSEVDVDSLVNFPNTPFKTDFFVIAICLVGTVEVEINQETNTYHQFQILTATPASIVQFKQVSDDFKMNILFFDKSFLLKNSTDSNLIFQLGYFRKHEDYVLTMTDKEAYDILSFFDYLIKVAETDSPYQIEIIQSTVFTLLFTLAELYLKRPGNSINKDSKEIYPKFSELIQIYLPENKALDFYAQELCVSTKYLIELIKKEKNTTPRQIIDDQLAKEASILLSDSNMTVKEIAEHLQFSSTASFTRFFKRMTGYTPTFYQKSQISVL